MHACLVVDNREFVKNPAWKAVRDGLEFDGHIVSVVSQKYKLTRTLPNVAFVWNGAKNRLRQIVDDFRGAGVRTFILERGFFHRMRYTQIDDTGFNHTASWCGKNVALPKGARNRLFRVLGQHPVPVVARDGYILVLCQVNRDAQLADSDVQRAEELAAMVVDAVPVGTRVVIRPHPLHPFSHVLEIDGSLADVVRDAAFVVTINSNAGNEALAMGRNVLAFGPSLYTTAGVALQTTRDSLAADIRRMLDGWTATKVEPYLQLLACRQWNAAEIREGSVLRQLLEN